MNLFFETAGQAQAFLAAVPLGLLLAACLDASAFSGPLRPVLDVLVLLLGSVALLLLTLLMRDGAMRAYHVLAVLTGALLYMNGVGKLLRKLCILSKGSLKKLRKKPAKRQDNLA